MLTSAKYSILEEFCQAKFEVRAMRHELLVLVYTHYDIVSFWNLHLIVREVSQDPVHT